MHDSTSKCISALPATAVLGRLLFISSSFTRRDGKVPEEDRFTCWPWTPAKFATLKPQALHFHSWQKEEHAVSLACLVSPVMPT